jgi:hypothetical protein
VTQFIRGGDSRCDGCRHQRRYRKYYCQLAEDKYCDTEEPCRVQDEAEASEGEEQDA